MGPNRHPSESASGYTQVIVVGCASQRPNTFRLANTPSRDPVPQDGLYRDREQSPSRPACRHLYE